MKQLRDSVWQRRGTNWLREAESLAQVGTTSKVWSLRQIIPASGHWLVGLPSNDDNTLAVAGLDGCLDLLTPAYAESWVASAIKDAILSFQEFYNRLAGQNFWLPSDGNLVNPATDAVSWRCTHPSASEHINIGRALWGKAHEYPQETLLPEGSRSDGKPPGLFHSRII